MTRQPPSSRPLHRRVSRPFLRLRAVAALGVVSVGLLAPSATIVAAGQPAPSATEPISLDRAQLSRLDALIEDAIGRGELPGAVVLVGLGDQVVFEKAYGSRAIVPGREPMTVETIFDLASLTKVVATSPSVMRLVEEGRIRLTDRVASFIPEFGRYGKDEITVRQLLAHVSGLRPDLDWSRPWEGYETAIDLAIEEVPLAPPGERFIYSDINFILLGEIVRRVSGMPLDEFAGSRIFGPLGMNETGFRPAAGDVARIAPTESCPPLDYPCGGPGSSMLRGVVHDPTTRRMGGVSGHAGLFSTARDLAIFCRMFLEGGAVDGVRVLAPLTIARMIAPASPPGAANQRGLGWDLDSVYSSNRGELMTAGSFGHTGFTGTSLWLDPRTGLYVVFLSNRVHPDGTGNVTPLRARVATVVAAALRGGPALATAPMPRGVLSPSGDVFDPSAGPAQVMTGIDVLVEESFARLEGKRIGLLTNRTGVAADGRTTLEILHEAVEVELTAIFSPEHGLRTDRDEAVDSGIDADTGLPIHSLYGATRRPTAEMLDGLDAVVVDLQDAGARFYTYMTTVAYLMEEAGPRGVEVVVLDRPNPINGTAIEGPVLETDLLGFTGYLEMPIRHGLTLGELARLFEGERGLEVALDVVPMRGWTRDLWYDETGLGWIDPSPNLRSVTQAALYPGIGAIEWSNISVGRGTDAPFEHVGAPWIDGVRLARELNAGSLPGVQFYPVAFTPAASRYAGERCEGVRILVTDRAALRPVRVGVELAAAIERLHPDDYDPAPTLPLLGSRSTLAAIERAASGADLVSGWDEAAADWRLRRAPYLLYP